MNQGFSPRPKVSYNLLLNALSDGPKTEEELRKFADENKLFFGIGMSLTGALLQLRYPGTNFENSSKWGNDPRSESRREPAKVEFDKESQTWSLTEVGRTHIKQPGHERA